MPKHVPNIRTMEVTTSSGKPVSSTRMLKGEAKDSLSGKNTTKEYSSGSSGKGSGPWGGENTDK